ncbi:hypothetical protein CB0940_02750 [Cercospora beticola]|uniref:Anaphase-promoting complex subunit 4 n=1 Tax=Cercospora beticola TaxID=122368 RepID=A0A2G5I331_CERBT|nr:hypothetical protein CB0940_02750 [Cercospora beticola]PIA99180.1 hypothetical protein CB0940_02750 [Cercospora beticola]WPA99898.1 hypothetical protein RHO25_004518 [Cercospora beticola]CAK1361931.1 unnamed protein product [Cercospora beticola]
MTTASQLSSLSTLSSKRLPQSIKFPFTAYSHKHDLLAVVVGPSSGETAWEVQVFRILYGQIAFSIKRSDAAFSEKEIEVTAISWKPDGTSLGVGWSDGKYGIYDGGTGRQLRLAELPIESSKEEYALDLKLPLSFPDPEDESEARGRYVAVMGFMEHQVPENKKTKQQRSPSNLYSTEDWYESIDSNEADGGNAWSSLQQSNGDKAVMDLPRAIAALDIATVLPRLSAIPSHGLVQPKSGAGASKFGTQAAADTQFDAQNSSIPGVVQSLVVCPHAGTVQVLVDETVNIGDVASTAKPVAHAAHPEVSTHAVLCQGNEEGEPMQMTFLDLPLSTLNGSTLHTIATNTKRTQTLLDYIVQTARCIQFDYATNVVVPSRFVKVLEMDLEDKHPNDGDALANLYHLAMTGSFHPQVLEWIVDIVKDTNIRRWETHMNTLYGNIQSHLFINLLPALDRFSVAVTALRGQAKYHENATSFDCSPKYFDALLENIDCIRLVAQKMQLIVQSEHRQFRAFSKWLKMQVDIAVAEPFSQNAMETEEREVPNIDYALVLTYIKNNLLQSDLAVFIENRPTAQEGATCDRDGFKSAVHIRDMSYERTKEVVSQMNKGQELKVKDVADPESLVNLSALVCGLIGRTDIAVKHVTEWQNRLVFPPTDPPSIVLDRWPAQIKALGMTMSPSGRDGYVTNVLGIENSASNELQLLSIAALTRPARSSVGNGNNAVRRQRQWTQQNRQLFMPPGLEGEFLDATFVPFSTSIIIALLRAEQIEDVLLVAYGIGELASEAPRIVHQFSTDNAFRPEKLLVGGRPGKQLCIVFGNKGREWRALDLQSVAAVRKGEDMEVG